MTGSAAQELGKRNGMRLIRVLARDQTVFKDIPPARLIKIVRAGIQNVRDLVGIGNGHRAGALFVRDGVQRNGQIERDAFLGELHHFGDDAARRKTDIARADADALRIRHAAQKAHDVLVIVKGFAAAHQNEVGDRPILKRAALCAVDDKRLGQDLPRCQVAYQPV